MTDQLKAEIIADLAANPDSFAKDIAARLGVKSTVIGAQLRGMMAAGTVRGRSDEPNKPARWRLI